MRPKPVRENSYLTAVRNSTGKYLQTRIWKVLGFKLISPEVHKYFLYKPTSENWFQRLSSNRSISNQFLLSFVHQKLIIFVLLFFYFFYFFATYHLPLCVGYGACAAFWLQGPLPAELSPVVQYCHDSANQEYKTQSLALQSLRENAREHVTDLKQQHRNQTICEVNNNTSNYQLSDDVIMHTVDKYVPLSRPTTLAIPMLPGPIVDLLF